MAIIEKSKIETLIGSSFDREEVFAEVDRARQQAVRGLRNSKPKPTTGGFAYTALAAQELGPGGHYRHIPALNARRIGGVSALVGRHGAYLNGQAAKRDIGHLDGVVDPDLWLKRLFGQVA